MARTLTLLTAVAALGVMAYAADPADDQPTSPPPGRPASARPDGDRDFGPRGFRPPAIPLMTVLDADKDGEISAQEIEKATAALKTLDGNDDGRLTRDELRPQFAVRGDFGERRAEFGRDRDAGPAPDRAGDRPPRRPREEGDRPAPERGDRSPRDARGPDRADRPAPARPDFDGPGRLIDHVMSVDANDDEELSQEEFLKLFAAADRNDDGSVSRRELEDSLREFVLAHGPRGPRPPQEGQGPDRDHGPDDGRPERPQRPE